MKYVIDISKKETENFSFTGSFIAKTSAYIIIITIISRIIGLFREAIIAGYFGAGSVTDAFFAAFRIPDILFNSLLTYLIALPFIPIFSEYLISKEKKEKWEFASNILNLILIFGFAFTALIEIFAPSIISFIAPGLNEAAQSLAIKLTRIMVPIVIFGALTGFGRSILNSMGHFLIPSIIPIIYNIFVIFTILISARYLGIVSLAIGILFASIFQFIIHFPLLIRKGIRYYPYINMRNMGVIRFWQILFPLALALILDQAVSFIEIYLSSKTSSGALSYLSYSNRIYIIPEQIFIVAISTVIFPALAADVANGNDKKMLEKLNFGIRTTIFIILPISFIIILFSPQIIKLLLGRGAFESSDIYATSKTLTAYSSGLLAVCIRHILVRAFLAIKDSKTLLKLTALMVPINVILDLVLVHFFSYWGLALGFSITAYIHMFTLIVILQKKVGATSNSTIIHSFMKISVCSIIMSLLIIPLRNNINYVTISSSPLRQAFLFIAMSCIAAVAFLFSAKILKVKEAYEIWNMLFKKTKSNSNSFS